MKKIKRPSKKIFTQQDVNLIVRDTILSLLLAGGQLLEEGHGFTTEQRVEWVKQTIWYADPNSAGKPYQDNQETAVMEDSK